MRERAYTMLPGGAHILHRQHNQEDTIMTIKRVGMGIAAAVAALGIGTALAAAAPVPDTSTTTQQSVAVERGRGRFVRNNAQTEGNAQAQGYDCPNAAAPDSSPSTDPSTVPSSDL